MAQASAVNITSRRKPLARAVTARAIEDSNVFANITAAESAFAKLKAAEARCAQAETDASVTKMDRAYSTTLEALDVAVATVPTSMRGVMALLKLQRDLSRLNWMIVEKEHLSDICESVETALRLIALRDG
jgi:hypothetical protein